MVALLVAGCSGEDSAAGVEATPPAAPDAPAATPDAPAAAPDAPAAAETGEVTEEAPALIMATTTIWADVTRNVACGGLAEVESILPPLADPHDYEPSMSDRARLDQADMIVANGLELEEGLEDILEAVEADGTPVFAAGDHMTTLEFDAEMFGGHHDEGEDHGDEETDDHGDEDDDDHGDEDDEDDDHGDEETTKTTTTATRTRTTTTATRTTTTTTATRTKTTTTATKTKTTTTATRTTTTTTATRTKTTTTATKTKTTTTATRTTTTTTARRRSTATAPRIRTSGSTPSGSPRPWRSSARLSSSRRA